MITRIHIENFKGIKERQTIELKPITLLFGPNSSGKSTVVQALHYAREVLDRRNFDPDRTKHGGGSIDLGGFKSLVYNHDLRLPIILKLDMDISNQSLPEYSSQLERDVNYYEIGGELLEGLDGQSKSISLKVKIQWHESLNKAIVTEYETGINDETMAKISLDNYTADGKSTYKISHINHFHSYFPRHEVELRDTQLDLPEFLLTHWSITSDLISPLKGDELDIKLSGQTSAIPQWGELLRIDFSYFKALETDEGDVQNADLFVEFLTRVLVGPGQLITDELNKFRYIGPIREILARNYEAKRFPDETRWANGLGAWDTLYTGKEKVVEEVSEWMSRGDRLNTGYSIDVREYKELFLDSPLMISLLQGNILDDVEDLRKKLEKIPNFKRVVLVENEKQIELLPFDIGIGISQVLPIVVGALDQKSSILAIEQPELHVHPAIQVNLGDLFISQIQQKDCIFLLETHSEHLMLRLLRRIEETHENELPPGKEGLKPEQVSVMWFEQSQDGSKITQLPIDETGEFTRPWPRGFFEERAEELFG